MQKPVVLKITLFQNGRHYSILLFTVAIKSLLPRVRENILLNFEFRNEATRAYLEVNKRNLNGGHFGIRCIYTYLVEFEVHTVSYGPIFFPYDL